MGFTVFLGLSLHENYCSDRGWLRYLESEATFR